jgi:2',3'-cyclic-nucleotide 2'-phosphodiesterase (5'-nucleotidase family)
MPTDQNAVIITKLGQAAIMQTTMLPERKKPAGISIQAVDLNEFTKDPRVKNQVKGYSNRLNRLLEQPIAVVNKDFETLRHSVRTEQNAFANMLTDTLREFSNADIALINGGIIRGNKQYQAHQQLTHKDIAQELPFRSRIALLNISGAQLIEALENGLSLIEKVRGRFPHVSGITVTYDPDAPVNHRVKSVLINGKALDKKHIYKLATTDYLANGGDGYRVLEECPEIVFGYMLTPLILDVLVDRIRQLKTFSPTLDARLVKINE